MGTITVKSGETAIVERFGKFHSVKDAGFHWINPITQKVRCRLDMRLQQLKVNVESKTEDNVFVKITVSVHYRIVKEHVDRAYYEMSNPVEQIRAYVFDVVRSEVPKKTLDEIFIVKEELAAAIKVSLKNTMEKYGFEIMATPVTDIDPDHTVKHALNEKTRQLNLKLAMQEKAEADKMVAILTAEGLAETTRIQAQADADAKHAAGQGLSRQRLAIVDGLAQSVKDFQEGVADVSSKDVMDLIMITQYFDMMHHIGTSKSKGTNTIFIPHSPGAVSDIASQLRNGFLEAKAGSEGHDTIM
jgi:regulator of protease activity HflC (stomatin/prohibitin superfamily)